MSWARLKRKRNWGGVLHFPAEPALVDVGMLSSPQPRCRGDSAESHATRDPHHADPALSGRRRDEIPSLPFSPSPSPSRGTHPGCRREARKGGRHGFGTEEEEGEVEEDAVGKRGAASRPAGPGPAPSPAAAAGCRLPAWRWGWMEGEPGGGRGWLFTYPERGNEKPRK